MVLQRIQIYRNLLTYGQSESRLSNNRSNLTYLFEYKFDLEYLK